VASTSASAASRTRSGVAPCGGRGGRARWEDLQAGGQGAHGQRLDAVLGDDGERLGDHGSWVSWGRRSWSFMGALNHSERDRPSVVGSPDVAVACLLGGGVARSGTLPSLMFTLSERRS
jgi:hypothetical protein